MVFADFVQAGHFDRHLRRMRPRYRNLRDALVRSLARRLPELVPIGAPAGLRLMARLPAGLPEAIVIQAAGRHGVRIHGTDSFWFGAPPFQALILGYGGLTASEIVRGVDYLADAIDSLR